MALQTPTKTEPVFASRHGNLIVVRFPGLGDVQNGLQRKLSPGLRYHFGRESDVRTSDGNKAVESTGVKVTDALRKRDRDYIAQYGHLYDAETDVEPSETDGLRGWQHQKDRFWTTEEFLRWSAFTERHFYEVEPAAPGSADTLEEIAGFAIDGDVDALVNLLEQEQEEWARPDVVKAATHALEKLASAADRDAENGSKGAGGGKG